MTVNSGGECSHRKITRPLADYSRLMSAAARIVSEFAAIQTLLTIEAEETSRFFVEVD